MAPKPRKERAPPRDGLSPGAIYYKAGTDDDASIIIGTHILRTVRGKYGYLTEKIEGITWIKFGWGKTSHHGWALSISHHYRQRFRIETGPPEGFARSITEALRAERRSLERSRGDWKKDAEMLDWHHRSIEALSRRLKREMGKKARAALKGKGAENAI